MSHDMCEMPTLYLCLAGTVRLWSPTPTAAPGAGEEPGLEIYRIVNFEVTAWDKRKYGEFFSGDAYIILKTGKTRSGSYSWDLHFWLGKDSSQDEQGTAAIKSVELDDALGGQATQWREVQNHESSQFISYFKKGIIYLEGGAESGFTKVDRDAYTKRLLKVKGHRNVRCHEVERKCSSLNMGDVFILDCLAKHLRLDSSAVQANRRSSRAWRWRGASGTICSKVKLTSTSSKTTSTPTTGSSPSLVRRTWMRSSLRMLAATTASMRSPPPRWSSSTKCRKRAPARWR
ncbi:PREDICTED: gelsolin, cytoplasmic-like [Priapulus caudatus]|uniref:Gelsolin, cytoplasmic-like n=1 Tax=Priapulus caudatus TaxID=37621 RepID=A0ABM1EJE0_PRICU|nr:PREDICTED: gelsolin, cytoplasmic-like [Priapulus caudatus]